MEGCIEMRNSYWQVVRGICILGVILIHCLVNGDYNEDTLLLVMRRSINFVVAVFVFMSGYFVDAENVRHTSKIRWMMARGGALAHTI